MSAELTVFLLGAFIAAFAAGLAGFAFGLLASALWLHVLPPVEATPLVVASGLSIHLLSIWRLRRAVRLDRLWPFILGGAIGVPLGAALLPKVDPAAFRIAIGVFMVVYSSYMLTRRALPCFLGGGRLADSAIGAAGGVFGGLAGLNGVLPTIWCDLRGWPRDDQRGVYQPYILVTHLLALLALGAVGTLTGPVVEHYLLALPLLALGGWLGLVFYERIDAVAFRRVLLVMLLVSGVVLLI